MRAILAHEFGGPEVMKLAEVPDPVPGPAQVRVRIQAAGVNPFDTYMRAGGYPISPALPYTPGADAAGVVDLVGEGVTTWQPGARVYIGGTALSKAYGTYAEMAVCDLHQVHPLPERVTFAQGASIGVPYITAWYALFNRGQARPGDTLLVHGASGGVGVAATQLARAAGLTVIGTAGTREGMEVVRQQGAHHVLDHRDQGYLDAVTRLTGGSGPDVILENLANVNLDHDLTIIGRGGRIIVVGSRGRVEIDPRKAMAKEAAVVGFVLWQISPDHIARAHRGIGAGLENGSLTPVVGTALPLARAPEAHVQVMAPGAKGKIVLLP